MTRKYRFTPLMAISCLGMTIVGVTFITLGSILPLLRSELGITELQAGYLASSMPFGILVGSLGFGPVVDRYSYKYLIVCSLAFISLGLAGISISTNLISLISFFILVGAGGGALNGATNSLVSEISENNPKNRGANLSFLSVFFGVGALSMPVAMGYLTQLYTYNSILLSVSLTLILIIILFSSLTYPPPKQKGKLSSKDFIELLRNPLLTLLGLFLLFQSGIEGVVNNWTPLYLESVFSLPGSDALYSLSIYVGSLTVARLALSVFMRSVSPKPVLIVSVFIMSAGWYLLYNDQLLIAMITLGIGSASAFPLAFTFVGKYFNRMSGMAFSLVLFYGLLGNMIVNYMMGYLSDNYGLQVYETFIISSIALTLFILIFLFRKAAK